MSEMRPLLSTIAASLAAASLAAASLVAITQILTTTPDHFLLIAVWIFALSLPFLVMVALNAPVKRHVPFTELTQEEQRGLAWVFILIILDIGGFVCVFFHFGLIAGLVFLSACSLAFALAVGKKPPIRLSIHMLLLPIAYLHVVVLKSYKRAARWWKKRS
jgi:hypothetical protein